jgi:hypothetical protein
VNIAQLEVCGVAMQQDSIEEMGAAKSHHQSQGEGGVKGLLLVKRRSFAFGYTLLLGCSPFVLRLGPCRSCILLFVIRLQSGITAPSRDVEVEVYPLPSSKGSVRAPWNERGVGTYIAVELSCRGSNPYRTRHFQNGPAPNEYATAGRYALPLTS